MTQLEVSATEGEQKAGESCLGEIVFGIISCLRNLEVGSPAVRKKETKACLFEFEYGIFIDEVREE